MATTGTFTYNPEFAELVDEAWERCGKDPAQLEARHHKSAARSAQLMLADWMTMGARQWTIIHAAPQTLTQGQQTFELPNGGWDIFHATLVDSQGYETEAYAISREDYHSIHDKDMEGRPDRYWVDKSTFIGANPKSTVYIWQVPNLANETSTIDYYYIRRIMDAGQATAGEHLELPFHWTEAFSAGLAAKLAVKFAPDRLDMLTREYNGGIGDSNSPGGALGRAMDLDRETSDTVLRVNYGRRRGRW